MFVYPLRLTKPGLFITATDTGVGKTVVTCAIANALRNRGLRVGVCKPFATGCVEQQGRWVSPDAQALAYFSACAQPLEVINPIRYAMPVAPAVAAQVTGQQPDVSALTRSLEILDAGSDALLIEGIGGVMVPLMGDRYTVLDLAAGLGYPVLVVTRATLGTLNHTAMTVRLLRDAGCRLAGLVVNGSPGRDGEWADPSVRTNCQWLEKMNRLPVLAVIPGCQSQSVQAEKGLMPAAIHDAVGRVDWLALMGREGAS